MDIVKSKIKCPDCIGAGAYVDANGSPESCERCDMTGLVDAGYCPQCGKLFPLSELHPPMAIYDTHERKLFCSNTCASKYEMGHSG